MIRILHHLFLLIFLLSLGASSAQYGGENTGKKRIRDGCSSSTNSAQPLLPCKEVSALESLANDLGHSTFNVTEFLCTQSSPAVGPLEVKCHCDNTTCHILGIEAIGSVSSSKGGSSSSSSKGGSSTTASISPDVSNLEYLQNLTLSSMSIQSSIPDSLGNLSALVKLDLSDNQLSGNIPSSIGNLKNLTILDLSNNQLSGNISASIDNLNSLVVLDLSLNQLSEKIPPNIGNLNSLLYLDLSYNLLSGNIPASIDNLNSLVYLYLDHNLLEGAIPDLKSLVNLTELYLNENQLRGSLRPELGNLKQLSAINVGSNYLKGQIPKNLFDQLPSLQYFGVYGNNMSGEIPGNIAKCKNLTNLVLVGNNFDWPSDNGIFNMLNLRVLSVSDLHMGNINILQSANLTKIDHLTLRNCHLSGSILDYIRQHAKSLTTLSYLDLSFNNLSDKLLPNELQQDRNTIALDDNTLGEQSFTSNGTLKKNIKEPTCSEGYRKTLYINCGGGELRLPEAQYEKDNDNVSLQSNDYTRWAYSCRGLSASEDHVKNLSCAIGFSDLTLYATARVCPVSLKYYGFCLRNGKYNVTLHFAEIEYAKNEDYSSLRKRIFDIKIQNVTERKDFSIVDEAGGPAKDVSRSFPNVTVTNHTLEIHLYWAGKGTLVDTNDFNGVLISAISVNPVVIPGLNTLEISFIALACVVFLGIIVLALAWQQGWIGNKELYEKRIDIRGKKFTVKQLIKATQNFSPKKEIGKGGFGAVYKAELGGQVIAVKKLSPRSRQGILEFRRELYSLKSLRHPKFVELFDGYSGHGFHLLIYEYMENKSLADVLFDPNSKMKLNWEARYKICKDVAIGLKYIHEESHLSMIHGDIKASNILLDGELNAKISDFGLAKIYTEDDQATVVKVGGTTGYMAPEYAAQGILSHKADVYSFGVVLLEIVSGRKNAEYKPSEETEFLLDSAYVLHKKGKSMNLVDEDLKYDLSDEEAHQAKSVLLLAMMCISLSPSLRPKMSELMSVLEGERTIEQVSDEYAPTSASRSIGSTSERLPQRNWTSTDHTPGSTDISSAATTTYFVIKEKDGKRDNSPGSSLEISHNTEED